MDDSTMSTITTEEALTNLISTLTAEEIMQLIASLPDRTTQAAFTQAVIGDARPLSLARPLKACNAFVAYRTYYILIPLLSDWAMKHLSGVVSTLWLYDDKKKVWAIMAKAYSKIRDQIGKEKAPLDQFLGIVCPRLNIVSPGEYLEKMGWSIVVQENGMPKAVRVFTPAPKSLGSKVTTALSVEDIIRYCQSMGYAQQYFFERPYESALITGEKTATVVEEAMDTEGYNDLINWDGAEF